MNKIWKFILILALIFFIFGIALMAVSALSGGSFDRIRTNVSVSDYAEEFNVQDIRSLGIEVGAGKLIIMQGDSFRVEASNIASEYFECRLENGRLIIRDEWTNSWSLNLSRGINIGSYEPTVALYLPAEFIADEAFINVAAGRCRIDGLSAKSAKLRVTAGELSAIGIRTDSIDVNMSAGSLRIDGLITDECKMQVSAGELSVNGLQVDSCILDVSAGAAWIGGKINSLGKFNCGLGRLAMELDGAVSDYDIAVQVGLGSVIIGEERISGSVSRSFSGSDGAAKITLDCGVGEIQMGFTGAHFKN